MIEGIFSKFKEQVAGVARALMRFSFKEKRRFYRYQSGQKVKKQTALRKHKGFLRRTIWTKS